MLKGFPKHSTTEPAPVRLFHLGAGAHTVGKNVSSTVTDPRSLYRPVEQSIINTNVRNRELFVSILFGARARAKGGED